MTQASIDNRLRHRFRGPQASPDRTAWRVNAYCGLLVAVVAGLATYLVLGNWWVDSPWVAALALLAALGERGSVRLSRSLEISISLLPRLFVAVVFGPLAAMIVGAASMAGDFRAPHLRWAVYTCTRSITGAAAGLLVVAAESNTPESLQSILLVTFVAVASGELLDTLFCMLTVSVRRSEPARAILRSLVPVMPTTVLLYTAVVSCLSYAYLTLSPWSVAFFLLPALAAQRLFIMYQAQRQLAVDLAAANGELERANLSFASALVTTLDARDRYTAGHSAAVAVYARDIAKRLGLSVADQQLAHLAGLVHDIGKIGVLPGVLEKVGPLTLSERRMMEQHPVIGERILANVDAYAEIALIVRHHHERIDGMGYPDKLKRDDIPLISRIICVADAYNAMTSDRPYRDAMPINVARDRLIQAAGSQFESDIVFAFDSILEAATEDYARATWAHYGSEAQEHPELTIVEANAA